MDEAESLGAKTADGEASAAVIDGMTALLSSFRPDDWAWATSACVLRWARKLQAKANDLPHCEHVWGFLPEKFNWK